MADFTSRFNELVVHYSGSDSELGSALGVSKQTISAWKSGKRFPKTPVVRTIASFFNVGIPWLMGITDDAQAFRDSVPTFSDLDSTESELLTIYRDLNALGQTTLIGTARGLAANPDMRKDGASKNETA